MKYELTPEELQELNRKLECNRKVMKAMRLTPESIEQKLKILRRSFYNKSRYRKKKIENLKIHRIMKRGNSVLDLLDQTFDILFPPEERSDTQPEMRLLNSVCGSRANIPSDLANEFVNRVTEEAERLVREYNQEIKVDK